MEGKRESQSGHGGSLEPCFNCFLAVGPSWSLLQFLGCILLICKSEKHGPHFLGIWWILCIEPVLLFWGEMAKSRQPHSSGVATQLFILAALLFCQLDTRRPQEHQLQLL